MNRLIAVILGCIVASLINEGDCFWQKQTPGWSFSNGGLTYKFNDRQWLTGYGKFDRTFGLKYGQGGHTFNGYVGPRGSYGLGYTFRWRRSIGDVEKGKTDGGNCNKCLEIQSIDADDDKTKNDTTAKNDFVMIVKLMEENMSFSKLNAQMKFEVTEIIKTPITRIKAGQTFTIRADLAKCKCLSLLDPGYYTVTGMVNDKNQLVLSSVLMEFEE